MEEIYTYEVLSQKIKAIRDLAKSKDAELYSNCYLLPNGFKSLIEQHRLFVDECCGNLYIFMKEESFFRLYYYVQNVEALYPLTASLPIEAEFLYRDELTEKQQKETSLIQQMKFSLGRESGRMTQKASEIQVYPNSSRNTEMYIDFASMEDKKIIDAILKDAFHPMFSFLPNDQQLTQQIAENNILVLHLDGKITGLLNMEPVKRSVWIRQLVVAKEHRGMGLGAVLLNKYHMLWKDKVDNFMQWVNLSNQPAIRLYQKMGYHFDGTKSNSYVYGEFP